MTRPSPTTPPRLVILGYGLAAARLVEILLRDAPEAFHILVVGEERRGGYDRIQLSAVLAGSRSLESIGGVEGSDSGPSGYAVLSGDPAVGLDRERQCVWTASGRALLYDTLVIATGASAVMPRLPGISLPGVGGFRDLGDLAALLESAQRGESVVVVGGGVLGVEAASGLAARGARVTLLHRGPWLMDRQLDEAGASLLADELRERGIQVQLQVEVASLIGEASLEAVQLHSGQRIPAQRVVFAVGIAPRIALAQSAGLSCQRGVVVDDQLRTSDPAIHALGDCAEHQGVVSGLVAPIWEQADVLARHLCGDSTAAYAGTAITSLPVKLKMEGFPVLSIGRPPEASSLTVDRQTDRRQRQHLMLSWREGLLEGAVLIGDLGPAPALRSAMGQALTPEARRGLLEAAIGLAPTPHLTKETDMKQTARPQLVVVGNGMVGQHLIEQLVSRGLHETHRIVVLGEEAQVAYDRVHLSEFFSGKPADALALTTPAYFSEHGMELRLGCQVTAIDRARRCVQDSQGRETPYDLLVLATGSTPFVPPIEGARIGTQPGARLRPGCFVYRTLDDLAAMQAAAESGRVGVVVGGGLLGLEAANALLALGLETHVVEFAPRLMPVQLDEQGGAMLRRKIEDLGVRVHLSKSTQRIEEGDEAELRMVFADGGVLETDLVVFSAGIRPQDSLARAAGLDLGERGGVVVNDHCQTSDPTIFAVGECAAWSGQVFGLVAPGYQMAKAVASQLAGTPVPFAGADLSTKLKLLGVDVASLGDPHGRSETTRSVVYTNERLGHYKRLLLSEDGARLVGAVLVGDAAEFDGLRQILLNGLPLPDMPESLILPASEGAAPATMGMAALPATAQVCSCHGVTKADLTQAVSEGCLSMASIKACTKAATGCGGCAALVKQVMEHEMLAQGLEVKKDLCEHFAHTRQELLHLVQIEGLRTFEELIGRHGRGEGCDICKPAVASILASTWNDYVLRDEHIGLQDTNDRFLANMQKDGTYSVVPRVPGGEITPDGLMAIGAVAKRHGLYTKITGGQRVDLFGARLEQLPPIWSELIEAGFETGHAYGKSLRTVKSCVGSTWCRYGVQDSVGLAVELEHRYKGLRAPHKIKFGVSGCTRECAEAQGKDVGIIATDKGWNLYVCGNGGMRPRHADLLASDLDKATLIRSIDRFLMYYVRTADRLQRTSTWLETLEGGLAALRRVVMEDSLGIGAELERQMQQVVDTYQCEWATTIRDPERLKLFRSFVNSDEPDSHVVFVEERGQIRPATPEERLAHVEA